MSSEGFVIGFLMTGVAIFAVAIAVLIRAMQNAHRPPDEAPMGDLPNVPEFIKRNRNEP
jgi:hypothetical protein